MTRKDCENAGCSHARSGGTRSARSPVFARALGAATAAIFFGVSARSVVAGVIRVHPTAVVTGESVRLDDACELDGFDAETSQRLGAAVVGASPVVGGSRFVTLDAIRSAVAGVVKISEVTIRGATQCAVSRPTEALPKTTGESASKRAARNASTAKSAPNVGHAVVRVDAKFEEVMVSLRQAVTEHFNQEFSRYGGTAELVFDHTSDQVLDLSGPAYQFRVRPRQAQLLGLCPLEVDVLAAGSVVQTVPLVVQATMTRSVVVAKRTINQDATIQAADVNLAALSFAKLDDLGVSDPSQVIGQRAKRVISAGALLEMENLESVPLVLRGQLVTIISEVAGIRVVTTGKAGQDGRRGEVIKVRSVDDKKVEFDAIVTAPGQVRIGVDPKDQGEPRLALRGTP